MKTIFLLFLILPCINLMADSFEDIHNFRITDGRLILADSTTWFENPSQKLYINASVSCEFANQMIVLQKKLKSSLVVDAQRAIDLACQKLENPKTKMYKFASIGLKTAEKPCITEEGITFEDLFYFYEIVFTEYDVGVDATAFVFMDETVVFADYIIEKANETKCSANKTEKLTL